MDDPTLPWMDGPPTDPPTNPWMPMPTALAAPASELGMPPTPAAAPRRRVSRLLIGAVVISVLLAGGAAFWLHQASQDRHRAQAQLTQARSNLDDEQAQATVAHDDLSQALLPGRALDSALTKPMATIGQLNTLDKSAETQMTAELQSGEAGIAGISAYNRAVDAANADVSQSNNLFQQMLDQTKDLPVD